MFNNPYPRNYNNYNQQNMMYEQNMYDQIDNQIKQLQQMREQIKNSNQQPAINQTFQLAPTNNHAMKFVDTIDEVNKEVIYYDTPFFSKDMSVLWLKNVKGEIKTYELSEIIAKDSKDMQIEYLQAQIEELKKGITENERIVANVDDEQITTDTTKDDGATRTTTKTSKSSSVSRVSRSKKE